MADDRTTYPEYRHALVARYGHFRFDQTWARTNPTYEREFPYSLVFEIDTSSEFDMMRSLMVGGEYRKKHAGAVPALSETLRLVNVWLRDHHPTPESGVVWIACYRRRIGPPDGQHEATPGEWYIDPLFRRPGEPMIDMHEAVPLVEAALRELEAVETETERHGSGF